MNAASNKFRIFDLECAEAMAHAFQKVCDVLRVAEDDIERRNVIADRIIAMAQNGVTTTPEGLYLRSIVAEVNKRPELRSRVA